MPRGSEVDLTPLVGVALIYLAVTGGLGDLNSTFTNWGQWINGLITGPTPEPTPDPTPTPTPDPTPDPTPPPQQTPFIYTEGSKIKDSSGKILLLHGVNNPNFLVDATGVFGDFGAWNSFAAQADAANLKSMGFNFVRVLINMDWYDQNLKSTWNGVNTANRGNRDCVNDYIGYCNQNGVYVLLVPWQIKGMPNQSGQTEYPWGISPYSTVTDFTSWCVRVVNYISPYPNVLFELYNEPHGDESTWFNAAQQAITAIRATSQIPIVIHWGYCGGFDWVARRSITGGNIIYSNHIYRTPLGNTMLSNMGLISEDAVKNYLITQWDYDQVIDKKPVIIGEIGAYNLSADELAWFRNTLNTLNDWGFGYSGWQWGAPGNNYPLQNSDKSLNSAGQILREVS